MPPPRPPEFDTLALHAGQRPDAATGARAVPIYETTSYVFADSDHAAELFNLERAGHIYSRISNPTTAVLEERVAALENGVGAVATASGMAALHLAIATLAGAGDHIVASSSLYGGTVNLLAQTLPRFGIATSFVRPRDHAGFAAAIEENTKLVIAETIGNPGLEVFDIPAVAAIAHRAGVPLLIDNTFATPYLSRPIELGADLVMHSLTKWIGGHGLVIGGAIIDGGNFDWSATDRFPTLTKPYAGYHGLIFAEEYGPAAFIMRARTEGLRDFGACLSPHNAARILTGVETLSLRMERHIANTAEVMRRPDEKFCGWLGHPSLARDPPRLRIGQGAAAARKGVDRRVRRQGRPAGGAQVHRGAKARQSFGQRWRRKNAGDPPRFDHPSADGRRAARRRRDRRGPRQAVGRPRGGFRHRRRPRTGATRLAEDLRGSDALRS